MKVALERDRGRVIPSKGLGGKEVPDTGGQNVGTMGGTIDRRSRHRWSEGCEARRGGLSLSCQVRTAHIVTVVVNIDITLSELH